MATKAADPESFLSYLESLLSYHEGSNNTDSIPVYDGHLDNRQLAALQRLDCLIAQRKDERMTNNTKHKAKENGIWKDPKPGADPGTVVRQQSFSQMVGRVLTNN
jgi:hypothetical protein